MAQTDLCSWCSKPRTSEAFSLASCDGHWADLTALLSARLFTNYLWRYPGAFRPYTQEWAETLSALRASSPASSESETHRTWEALPAEAP